MRAAAMRSAHGTNTASRLGLARFRPGGRRLHNEARSRPLLPMLVEFAQDIFPGVSLEDISISPASDGKLVVFGAIAVSKTDPGWLARDWHMPENDERRSWCGRLSRVELRNLAAVYDTPRFTRASSSRRQRCRLPPGMMTGQIRASVNPQAGCHVPPIHWRRDGPGCLAATFGNVGS
jgi:hypothetical protein